MREDMDGDNSENMSNGKNHDNEYDNNEGYERIIRKRKRKSSD